MDYCDKNQLRKQYKNIRLKIENKYEKSNIIENKLLNLDALENAKNIAIYCSMEYEVNTKSIIEKYLMLEKNIYLPKTYENGKMTFFKINSIKDARKEKTSLKINLNEPSEKCEIMDCKSLDAMIIPGICFDKNKNRIGFGKGFYDKYLSDKSGFVKIGICFDEQILKDGFIKNDNYDISMDIIVTENEIIY